MGESDEALLPLPGNALGRPGEVDAVGADVGDELPRHEHSLTREADDDPGHGRMPFVDRADNDIVEKTVEVPAGGVNPRTDRPGHRDEPKVDRDPALTPAGGRSPREAAWDWSQRDAGHERTR